MNAARLPILAVLLAVCAGCATQAGSRNVTDPDLPRQLQTEGAVSVSWDDPAGFTELTHSGNRWEAQRGNWVHDLAEYMQQRVGKVLPAGQRMDIHITNIARAGRYEPGRGPRMDSIRVLRDIYPPRLSFDFKRLDANGQVIDEGQRRLSDMSYLMRPTMRFGSDPLAYEKRLIDDWISRELRPAGG
jgi:hypothetical protein